MNNAYRRMKRRESNQELLSDVGPPYHRKSLSIVVVSNIDTNYAPL